MKIKICIPFFILFCTLIVAQENNCIINLNGRFYGEPIYVQNPYTENNRKPFCTDSVLINDVRIKINNSSAYMIDLELLGLELGDSINIKVYHEAFCYPKVLNLSNQKENLIEIKSVEIDVSGNLEWEVSNQLFTSYKIEQYKWNRWIEIKKGNRVGGETKYTTKVKPLFGSNKFKIILEAFDGSLIESKTLVYSGKIEFGVEKVEIISNCKSSNNLNFTDSTYYEVYDQFAELVKKGYNKNVDFSKLKKGLYYVNYDNTIGEIFNRK